MVCEIRLDLMGWDLMKYDAIGCDTIRQEKPQQKGRIRHGKKDNTGTQH